MQVLDGLLDNGTFHTPRVATASLALTGGSVADVFTVAGGPVLLLGLFTHITTAVSNNACNFKWQSDPTSGAASTDLCGNVEIAQAAIGDVFYITGASGTAQAKAANAAVVALSCSVPAFLLPGGVDAVLANSNPTTGAATVYLVYRPLAEEATVT
jgi:hypothetical protein